MKNPWDAREVAQWFADVVSSQPDEDKLKHLWVRITLDGPGYMVTEGSWNPSKMSWTPVAPKSGVWRLVSFLNHSDAVLIHEKQPRGWPRMCVVMEHIKDILDERKST